MMILCKKKRDDFNKINVAKRPLLGPPDMQLF